MQTAEGARHHPFNTEEIPGTLELMTLRATARHEWEKRALSDFLYNTGNEACIEERQRNNIQQLLHDLKCMVQAGRKYNDIQVKRRWSNFDRC